MTAAQRLQLFWVAATSMRDSPASGLAAPSADVFRCFPNRLLASSSRLYGASQQHALAPSFTRPIFHLPGIPPHTFVLCACSRSGASVAEAVAALIDPATLKQHSSPADSCGPIVVVLCMTSDCVNAVAAALRSALPRALVGKMYDSVMCVVEAVN